MAEVKAPCWAEVSIDAIVNNFRQVRQYVRRDCRCLAIVKADAYGHGAVTVARALEAAGADRFGVATLAEARELRDAGITLPILILSYTPPAAAAELAQLNVMQSVTDAAYAEALNAEAAKAGVTLTVHVKVDTGMSRVGFVYHDEADDATVDDIARAAMLPQLQAEGLFTHFAMADAESEQATRRQFALFEGLTARLRERGITFAVRHCCNSAATLRFPEMQLDMVRCGIVLYGWLPDASMVSPFPLTPAMQWRCVVSQVKRVAAGTPISYGHTAVTERESVLATLPIGYADGLLRACSNRAVMNVGGHSAPIVGRVCMDQCMLDVTGLSVQTGDTVTVFGDGAPLEELAAASDTIVYEVICRVGKRVPRVYR